MRIVSVFIVIMNVFVLVVIVDMFMLHVRVAVSMVAKFSFGSMVMMVFGAGNDIGMGINSQPFINNWNTMRVAMAAYKPFVKGIGRIAKTEKHK